MSNLLPAESLRSLRTWQRNRFILVGSLTGAVLGALVLLALAPLYVVSLGEEKPPELTTRGPESAADRAAIARAQLLVREFKSIASSTSPVDMLNLVLGARPKGVTVTSMSYVRGDPGTITVSGVAPSREEISAYRSVLSKDPRFKSVSVPIGTLTGGEGGRFTITVSGTF